MHGTCIDGNHTIGLNGNGKLTLDEYVDSDRRHPGEFFKHCPDCGLRLLFLDDMAEKYESSVCGHNSN